MFRHVSPRIYERQACARQPEFDPFVLSKVISGSRGAVADVMFGTAPSQLFPPSWELAFCPCARLSQTDG